MSGVCFAVHPFQCLFRPAGRDAPRAGNLVYAQVACHGLARVRVDRRTCQVAYVEAGPAADALLIVGGYRLVGLADACIHRAHLDAGCIITGLADDGLVLDRVVKGEDLNARAMGAQDAMMRHGTGQFTEMAAGTAGGINEDVPVFLAQNTSLQRYIVHYNEQIWIIFLFYMDRRICQ